MNWKRAVGGGILAEVLVFVLLTPVALVVGLDRLGDSANLPPSITYGVVLASFVAPVLLTQWVARRPSSHRVLQGLIVGLTAFAVYIGPILVGGQAQPPVYWAAHAMKILGGLTGGVIAARRHAGRPTSAAV